MLNNKNEQNKEKEECLKKESKQTIRDRIKSYFKKHPKLFKTVLILDRCFSIVFFVILVISLLAIIVFAGKTGCSKTAKADTKTKQTIGYESINRQLVLDNPQAEILPADKIYTGYIFPEDNIGGQTPDRTHGNLMIKISNVGESLLFNNNIYLTLPLPYPDTWNNSYDQLYYAVYPIQVYYYQTGIAEGLKKQISINTTDFFSYNTNEFLYNMKHSEWTNTDVGFIEPDYTGDNIKVHYSTTYYTNMGDSGLLEYPIYKRENKISPIKPAFTASFEMLGKTVDTNNNITTEGKLYFSFVVYLLNRRGGETYFINSEGTLKTTQPTEQGVIRANVLKYKNLYTNPFLNNPETGEYFEITNGKKILSLSAVRGNSTSTTKVIFSTPGLTLTNWEYLDIGEAWRDAYYLGVASGSGDVVPDADFLVRFADDFLNYKFFGFFSIGTLLGIMFAVLFMVIFLKYFAGS